MMFDIDASEDAGKKRTERIDSIVALLIVMDRIPKISEKETYLHALEQQLKTLSNYDLSEVVIGLGQRTMTISLVMELLRKPDPLPEKKSKSWLFILLILTYAISLTFLQLSK